MKLNRRIGNLLRRSGDWIGGIGTSSGYNAGSGSGRWSGGSSLPAPASQTQAASGLVSRRSAFAVANIPLAASLLDTQINAVLPDMPSVRSGHPSEAIRLALEQAFGQWSPPMTALVRGVERSRFLTGDGIVILRTDPGARLRLQLLPPDQLDRTVNRTLPNGGQIIAGVETDSRDLVVAFWVLPDAPDQAFAMIGPAQRIAADDVLHIYEKKFPGQRRGISEFAPVLPRLHELEKLQDSLLARAGTAALFGGFVTDPSGMAFGDATPPPASELGGLEPGALRILPIGTDIKFPAMPDMADAPALLQHMQRDICCGCGVPFELATGNLSTVNYSSAKVGMEAYKRRCKALRASILIPHLFLPIWRRWVMLEVLSGRLHAPDFDSNPEPYFAVSFLFSDWAALDPLKDVQADIAALQAGLRSRAEIIAARGRDIADVDAEISADSFVQPAPTAPAKDDPNA